MMRVEPGQVAAVRFAVEGIVDGAPGDRDGARQPAHRGRCARLARLPRGPPGVHRVVVSGHPGVEINTHVGLDGVDHNEAGVIATAAKAVNAIWAVCAAEPGLVSLRDLPVSQVRHLMG